MNPTHGRQPGRHPGLRSGRWAVGDRRAATLLMTVAAVGVFVLVEIWALQHDTGNSGDNSAAAGSAVAAGPNGAGPVDVSGLRIAPDRHGRDYRREAFGPGWAPAVGPGCDIRDYVLARDLTDTTTRNTCDVTSGTLQDPYSGQTVTGPARQIDIDHVIPLALAHRSGAHAWTDRQREVFANDPDNLLAVSAQVNRSKSDKGPEQWMPPVDACVYAHDFVRVATRYQLTVTADRADALRRACT
ncbi:HNH endonuclease family protein [Pseudonocardia sp. Ae717_Ps2]|uniref:HNH endonuclease family protein n=1 Tax=Pseudonocardia sp. Ae717_Ps2 TaxID=1885573 RepID=UPI00130190FC|nr:HNH endonuclease family protein [Pseudonocardia sp. Ae717_Ps2]